MMTLTQKLERAHELETKRLGADFINCACAYEKLGIGSETTMGWLWSSISVNGKISHFLTEMENEIYEI